MKDDGQVTCTALLKMSLMTSFFLNASLPSGNHVQVAILAILISILWRIIIRTARTYVLLLESDVLRFLRNDDGFLVGQLPWHA